MDSSVDLSVYASTEATASSTHGAGLSSGENLRNGIWPREFSFWVIAFWMAWVVIRPWERLIPELAPFRPEFSYALFGLTVVILAGQFRIVRSFQTQALLCWIVALGASALFAYDTSVARGTLYGYLTYLILFFMILSVVRTRYQLVFFVACFISVMVAYLGKSQWEHFIHGSYGFSMGVRRLNGIDRMYSHPNSVAISTVLTMPFGFLLWTIRHEFTDSWPNSWRRCFPYFLGAYFWLAFSSIVLTNGRAGMLGAAVFLILTAMRHGKVSTWIARLALVPVIVCVIWVAMPEMSKSRMRTVWDPDSGSVSAKESAEGRLVGLQLGLETFYRFPVLGVGIGGFANYRVNELDGLGLKTHNTIGGVLAETGAVGASAFVIFLSGVFLNCARVKSITKDDLHGNQRILLELAVACRNSVFLILFLGLAGDIQERPQLYWVAAFCLLTRLFAERAACNEDLDGTATDGYAEYIHTGRPADTPLVFFRKCVSPYRLLLSTPPINP
ncbi:O-antigen ligase family protein [Pirellulales bacterium]|nr:O-antigen ligase family protein [Pirellulales bacterium]